MEKIHLTKNYKRVRISNPKLFDSRSFRIKRVKGRPDVKIITACPKGKFKKNKCLVGMKLQAKLYKRKRF